MPEVIVLTCGGDEFVEPHVWMSVYSMSSVVTSTGEKIGGKFQFLKKIIKVDGHKLKEWVGIDKKKKNNVTIGEQCM